MKKVIEIKVPKAWTELSNDQLYYVYSLLADNLSGTQIRTLCLFSWGKLHVVCRYGDSFLFRHEREQFTVPVEVIVDAIKALQYLEDVPSEPVRISRINGHDAADAELNQLPFGSYLFCENLYQGYLRTQNHNLLVQMANVLYDMDAARINQAEKMSVFYWWTAVKAMFEKQFPNFFVKAQDPAGGIGGASVQRQMQDAMNAQIRALTKGDITKEQQVLAMDTWRALTELDAMARETAEINRLYGKH